MGSKIYQKSIKHDIETKMLTRIGPKLGKMGQRSIKLSKNQQKSSEDGGKMANDGGKKGPCWSILGTS